MKMSVHAQGLGHQYLNPSTSILWTYGFGQTQLPQQGLRIISILQGDYNTSLKMKGYFQSSVKF